MEDSLEVKKRAFKAIYLYKMMILPRQARDKHRENSKKARFVEGGWHCGRFLSKPPITS